MIAILIEIRLHRELFIDINEFSTSVYYKDCCTLGPEIYDLFSNLKKIVMGSKIDTLVWFFF